jgi:hypothetical protein
MKKRKWKCGTNQIEIRNLNLKRANHSNFDHGWSCMPSVSNLKGVWDC